MQPPGGPPFPQSRNHRRPLLKYTIGVSVRHLTESILLLLAAASRLAPADTVQLIGKPPFRNVSIMDFRGERLVFRGVSGQVLRKPLGQVEWFAIDGQPDLNAAEQAVAGGDWSAALPRYEQALVQAEQPWLRALIRLRLLAATGRTDRYDHAIAVYIGLLTDGPPSAPPPMPAEPGSDANRRARDKIEAALRVRQPAPVTTALRTLLLELLLCDEADPLPPGLLPPTHHAPQPAGTQPTRPRTLGILPPAATEPGAAPPAEPPPQLGSDSVVLRAAQAAFDASDAPRAARLIERALPYVSRGADGPWQLLRGRCLAAQGQPAEAVSGLLSLAEHDPDPLVRARALYYAGMALERLERADAAREVYAELLRRPDVPDDVRGLAQAALAQLEPDPCPTPDPPRTTSKPSAAR